MKKILADTRSDSTASATRGLLSTALNSNPATHEADSDSDGLKDGAELTAGTQARNPDSDDDGAPDYGEASLTDSDGGGLEALTPRLNNRCAGSPLQRHRPFDRRAGNCGGV